MSDVNWWLMALAFLLGVILTVALTIRRVKREVPVYGALGRGPSTGAGGGLDEATSKLPKAGTAAAGAAAAGAAAFGASKFTGGGKDPESEAAGAGEGEKPYGAGSLRTEGTATAPEGYTVKGNEDSMLYHTAESPSYQQTVAEIWFVDEESAIQGGFHRWDSGQR
ncbi:channel accessory protein ArfC, sunset domain variant [Mycobacterium sp. NPDC003449]